MKKTKKRAFILSECNSPYIQQAIFILKDGFDSESNGVLQDAERIVSSYMGAAFLPKKKSAPKPTLATLISFSVALTITAIIYFIYR